MGSREQVRKALVYAARDGHREHVQNILSRVNTAPQLMGDGLIEACQKNQIEIVRLIVEAGADVNYVSEYRMSPIFAAIRGSAVNVVSFLLEKGCNVNPQKHKNDLSPLHTACYYGEDAIVKLLLQNQANCNWKCPIRWMLNSELDENVNLSGTNVLTPLLVSLMERLGEECALLVLEAGCECNETVDRRGWLPLHHAIRNGYRRVAKELVKRLTPEAYNTRCINSGPAMTTNDVLCLACQNCPEVVFDLHEHGFSLGGLHFQPVVRRSDADVQLERISFHNLFPGESGFQLTRYRYASPLSLLLMNKITPTIMTLLELMLSQGVQVNYDGALDVVPALIGFFNGKEATLPWDDSLSDEEHLTVLQLLDDNGHDPDYVSSGNQFGCPDVILGASLNDPRCLAFLLSRSKFTASQLLDCWVVIMEHCTSNRFQLHSTYDIMFHFAMAEILKVCCIYGQFMMQKQQVLKFIRLATEISHYDEMAPDTYDESMQGRCRAVVRTHLSQALGPDQRVKTCIESLPLPNMMKNFLMFGEIDLTIFRKGPSWESEGYDSSD